MFSGLPRGVSPVVFENRMLDMAAAAHRLAGNVEVDYDLGDLFRRCVSVCRATEHPEACDRELDAVARYSLAPEGLPEAVALFTPAAQTRLCGVTHDFSVKSFSGATLLYRWKTQLLREQTEWDWKPWATPKQSSKARVLFASNPSAYSGAEQALCLTIQALSREKYSLSAIVALDGFFAEQLCSLGVNVHVVGREFLTPSMENARTLSGLISCCDPDVLHINSACGSLLPALAKLHGATLLYHLRVPPSARVSDVVCSADTIVAVSHYVKSLALRLELPEARIRVVYDGVDTSRWVPVSDEEKRRAKGRLGIDPSKICVLMIARYAPNKRHDVLVEALARLPHRDRLHLILVGESMGSLKWEANIGRLLEETGISAHTTRLGFQNDIIAVEAAADICVLCSEREPLGMAVLEAMAMGIPVVVTEDGGPKELVVRREQSGLVVKAGSPEALAHALATLVDDQGLRRKLGAKGRRLCTDLLDARHCAAQIEEIYDELVQGADGGSSKLQGGVTRAGVGL